MRSGDSTTKEQIWNYRDTKGRPKNRERRKEQRLKLSIKCVARIFSVAGVGYHHREQGKLRKMWAAVARGRSSAHQRRNSR